MVAFIHREDLYTTDEEWAQTHPGQEYPRNIAEIIVAKNRKGPTGSVPARVPGPPGQVRLHEPGVRRLVRSTPPAQNAAGSCRRHSLFQGVTVGQFRVTNIVVVVNIYTYKYYYITGHFELPHGIPMDAQSHGRGNWRAGNASSAGRTLSSSATAATAVPTWSWALRRRHGEPGRGGNAITVEVAAEDGVTTKTYTVVIRAEAAGSDATLSALTLTGIDIGTFDPTITTCSADVVNEVARTGVSVTTGDIRWRPRWTARCPCCWRRVSPPTTPRFGTWPESKPPEAPALTWSGKPDLKIYDCLLTSSVAVAAVCG